MPCFHRWFDAKMRFTICSAPRFSLQHLDEQRFDLLWDAMQDMLHQYCRQHLIPGLAGILSQPRSPGLLGIVLSGAGPSVVALATENFDEIGKSIAAYFENAGLSATIRCLSVPDHGSTTTAKQ